MAPTLEEALTAFQRQVRTLADQVRQLENEAFRKALYVAMLDGLSACAYPNETRSGQRFRSFVLNIANWRDGERVSLPQSALYFQPDPAMNAAIALLLNEWTWDNRSRLHQIHFRTSFPPMPPYGDCST